MATQQTFDFLDIGLTKAQPWREKVVPLCSPDSKDERLPGGGEIACNPFVPSVAWGAEESRDDEAEPPQQADLQETDRSSVLRQLRAKLGCVSAASDDGNETLSTGSDAINRLLPRGGLRLDAITEWVAEADGCGAAALAMISVATHLKSPRGRGPLVVVSGQDNFYPPAAVGLGISADRIIWVRPTRHADLVWAIDQALRCESVAAVWAHVGTQLDDRDARRFQLAAEAGHTAGLFIRPAATRGRPSFADVRLHVGHQEKTPGFLGTRSRGRVMKVTLDRCRGARGGDSVWVQIDDQARIHQVTPQSFGTPKDEATAVRLASELAHPKTSNRKASRRRA